MAVNAASEREKKYSTGEKTAAVRDTGGIFERLIYVIASICMQRSHASRVKDNRKDALLSTE